MSLDVVKIMVKTLKAIHDFAFTFKDLLNVANFKAASSKLNSN